jgi:hypothetical protein
MEPVPVPTPVPDFRTRMPSPARAFLRAVRIASARLRFLLVFAVVFAVIGGWETIRAYWGRLTSVATHGDVISSDTEYFCPMDPGVLSDWPSKCPVCNMTLVRRKRGESAPLPDGVVARMQFTPYRLALGGIRTAAVEYAPLARTLEAPGTVSLASPGRYRVEADFFAREVPWIEAGSEAEVIPAGSDAPLKARVRERDVTARVVLEVEGKGDGLKPGDRVRVRVRCPVDRLEPFRSLPSVPPPLVKNEPRRLYSCMEHPDVVRDAPGRCPRDGAELMARALRENQRVRWWCPMHPDVNADKPGATCAACSGMPLVPRVASYRPPGSVLSIPCSAVIDDGARSVVYVETGPGMFDGRVVTLGPRCGDSFPVITGLEPGDRVAATGAFLIDAETRLNPSLAASYFGAGPTRGPAKAATADDPLAALAPADRAAAQRQKVCPVTGKPLGSMGTPPKLTVRGRTFYLCCDGCNGAVEADPERVLAKLPREGPGASP